MITNPFNKDNIFQWYSGTNPDRYTLFCSENFNNPINQILENTFTLEKNIKNILNGSEVATKISAAEINTDTIKVNDFNILKVNNNLRINDSESNLAILEYDVAKINSVKINNLSIESTDNDEIAVYKEDKSLATFKMKNITVDKIISDKNTIEFSTIGEEDNKEGLFQFAYEGVYSNSILEAGTYVAKDGVYSFSSSSTARRNDAIVYDDSNSGDTKNSFLFFADGKVDNSTLIAGDIKTVGADVAEYYEGLEQYEYGTVLGHCVDKAEVRKFETGMKVAGIVSYRPGSLLNQENGFLNPVMVCLTGRVKVMLNGTAKKGDYIIADTDGKAVAVSDVKSFKESKLVLGIALENSYKESINNTILIKV